MALYKKRERTQNWTPEEKILLLKLCGTKISILENKKADQYSLTIKNSVWKEIHQEFIAKLGSDRDVLRLKEQWQRMKKQARSELQDYKMRTKKHGDLAQLRKISNISEEVLKIMEIANKNNNSNTEEEDASISSSENSEQDNIPTYFCETEVKQEIDDKNDHDYQQKNFFINAAEDSEASLSSITAVINSQAKLKFNNHKNDSILNILNSYCHNNATEQQDNITMHNKMKRKLKDSEELQFLQTLFESKHKEHQKRMMIIEEQLKTAKIQRETAEIQKQIAQQELKHMLLQGNQHNQKEKRTKENLIRSDVTGLDSHSNEETYHKIHFHQNQIKLHEEEIDKHKQFMDEIIKKEYQN